MKNIVFATNNINKIKEFKEILGKRNINLLSLADIKYDKEIIEDGNSFEENALIKAKQVSKDTGYITISDDSGLCVDSLNGAPGIFSARYSGFGSSENNKLLLKNMEGIENRNAHFTCAICLYYPNGKYVIATGRVDGVIATTLKGDNGFGYDPLFYLKEYGKTMAEVSSEVKDKISHRANAIKKLGELVDEDFNII